MLDRTVQPELKPFHYQGFPKYETAYLDNGLEVILIPYGFIPVLEVQCIIRTGHCYEKENAAAQATFKLLTDGTHRFTSSKLAEALDSYGSEIASSAGFEQSVITLSTPSKHIHNTIPLLYEVYTQANFPENEWFIYQQRAIRSLEIEEKKTHAVANRLFLKKLWGNHPYGKKATKEDFQSLQLEHIHDFYQKEVLKNQVYWIVSGNFDGEVVYQLLNQYFGKLTLKTNENTASSKTITPTSEVGKHYQWMENSVQSSIKLGHLSVARNHQDYEELQVLGTLLGGFWGSRLMKNIREEKGFTYGIYGGFVGMKENGYFVISTDVANEYVEDTLNEIYKEIQILQNERVQEEELRVVKNYMMGSILSSLETPFQVADMLSLLKLNGLETNHLKKTLDLIKYITPERVLELSCKYLDSKEFVIVIAGRDRK